MFVSDYNKMAVGMVKGYSLKTAPDIVLICGSKGTGKSALLEKLYHDQKNKGKGMLLTGEKFAQYYASAVYNNGLASFRQKIRLLDFLLMDDIHTLTGKSNSIEELLHTCDAVISNGGKLVFATEGKRDLRFLGDRLESRLLSGLAIVISEPSQDELIRFLRSHLVKRLLIMENKALEELAGKAVSPGDAMDLLQKFMVFAEKHDQDLSFACFEAFWGLEQLARQAEPTLENIARLTAESTGVSLQDMMSLSRVPDVAKARQLAIYSMRMIGRFTYKEIGDFFRLSHGAGIHACKKIEEMLVKDRKLREDYEGIKKALK